MKFNPIKLIVPLFAAALLGMATPSFADEAALETTQMPVSALLNINTASAEQLTQMKGIGSKKAEAIVRFREENGPFASLDSLTMVRGIGTATIEKNRMIATAVQ